MLLRSRHKVPTPFSKMGSFSELVMVELIIKTSQWHLLLILGDYRKRELANQLGRLLRSQRELWLQFSLVFV